MKSAATIRIYAFSVVVTVGSVVLTRLTWPLFASTPFAPLFGTVAGVTHFGSGGAGLLSIAVAAVGAALAFPRTGPFPWKPATEVVFIGVALIGSRLIAGRNRAVAALRASEAELRATLHHLHESEATLRQAQKMEAVGQLAAGVAHNFNNLLTITTGYTEVLLEADADEELRRTAIAEIRKATDRGAALARQMLAFGRKHQPRVARVSLDGTVEVLRDMLTRVIREDIRFKVDVGTGPAAVLIDPHDLEQVIFNLVINARDALPEGGEIYVDTAVETIAAGDRRLDPSLPAGDYVRLRVRDNGIGMSPEVQARLFEPFFTTKEIGEGTGLGLALVHGVAQHGGGFVTVDSTLGEGTTVSVYLPPAAPGESAPAAADAPPEARREALAATTVLLVEDEDAVREMTARMLTRAGCRVLRAANPGEARALFDRHAADIAVVVTDVVMAEMRGPALVDVLRARRPDLRVLFVSGYTDTLPIGEAANVAFLAKPFSAASLRAALGALMVPEAGIEPAPRSEVR